MIEIGVPAQHVTTIDHEMTQPRGKGDREWRGQKFVHHRMAKAIWQSYRMAAFSCRDTGVEEGTKGVASIKVVRFDGGVECRTGQNPTLRA